jgi:hypothetical protein
MSAFDSIFVEKRYSDWGALERERDQDQRLNDASRANQDLSGRVTGLSGEVERLNLVVEALTELMVTRLGVTRYEVELMVERVDLADGVVDGRVGPDRAAKAIKCPSCERPVNPKRSECIYCGQQYDFEDLEARRREHAEQRRAAAEAERKERAANRKTFCSECTKVLKKEEVHFGPRGVYCREHAP